MAAELRKTYIALLAPAVVGLVLVYLAKSFKILSPPQISYLNLIAALTFTLAVVFAVALPIFFRTLFAHKIRHRSSLSQEELIKFERCLIYVSLATPYLTLISYLLEFPKFYFAGTVLMALYAVYFYYPSERRIQFEKRIFRAL